MKNQDLQRKSVFHPSRSESDRASSRLRSVTTSEQALYRSLRRKRQSSLTALLLLSPQSLKNGFAGTPKLRITVLN